MSDWASSTVDIEDPVSSGEYIPHFNGDEGESEVSSASEVEVDRDEEEQPNKSKKGKTKIG